MKKSLLAIILAVVMLLSFGVFAACQPDEPDPGPGPGPGPQPSGDADVPVTEGMVTIYFTMADDSVALPEYASVWFTGGQTSWAERPDGADGAKECINVENTKLYYVQVAYNAELEKANEYHLTLGYNAKSGLPADKQGIDWNYKSDAAANLGPLDNLTFEYDGSAQKIDLGTQKWSTELPKPERIAKTELRVTFSEALGENAEVYFMGGFNGWDATKAKATPNADRTIYSLELEDMLCTAYEFKILVFKDINDVTMKDAEGKDLGIWDRTSKADPNASAHIEIGAPAGNLSVSIRKVDNGSYIDLCDTVSEATEDVEKKGLDLSKAFKEFKKDADGNDTEAYTWKLFLGSEVTFTCEFSTALTGKFVYIAGSFEGWKGTKMTTTDDIHYTITLKGVDAGEAQFKVLVFDTDAFAWSGGVEFGVPKADGSGMENATVTVTAAGGTVALFAEPLVYAPAAE